MEIIRQYQPMPEDEDTEKWLHDETLHQGLIEFDEQLAKLMDPYWEDIYLREELDEFGLRDSSYLKRETQVEATQ
jgi:hypothetical protein